MSECKSCQSDENKEATVSKIDVKRTKDGKTIYFINTPSKMHCTCKAAGTDLFKK